MPIQNVGRGLNLAGDSTATGSTTVTANAAANTKGAWAPVFTSTTFDTAMIVLQPDDVTVSATNTSTLLDVGVGGSGSEVSVINNVNLGAWGHGPVYMAPMFIPKATRLSIRIQSAVASKSFPVRVMLIPAPTLGDAATWCETWGASTATSAGTTLPTPSVAGTKTGYQAITSSTTRKTNWITWSVGSLQTNVAASKGGIDIAYGAAGAESVVVSNIRWEQLGTEAVRASSWPVPVNIPAGQRIAARWDSTSTSSTSVLNLIVHGFA